MLALAPLIAPVLVPSVQAKVLAALAVNVIFGLAPLQIVDVFEMVTVGLGFTVTVIAVGLPTHEPFEVVGVII